MSYESHCICISINVKHLTTTIRCLISQGFVFFYHHLSTRPMADPEMILDPNPQPDRMQFVGVPDELSFSIWPQDPFVVLRDDRGESRLLTSRDYGRMEDREMARMVADALGWPVEESSLFFAGGNVLADERHAFVGADLIRANQDGVSERMVVERFQRELGRPVIVAIRPGHS